MILIPCYHRIRQTLCRTLCRFPLAVLCSLAFCFVSIRYRQISDFYIYLTTLFCGWCWFVTIQLFGESQSYRLRYLYLVAVPVFLVLGYYIRSEGILSVNIQVLWIGLFLAIFCAPFFNKSRHDLEFWLFNYRLWGRIAYAFCAALILFLGVVAVLSCLEYLFSWELYKDQYIDTGIISFTLFFPVLVLAGIPSSFEAEIETETGGVRPIYYLLEYLVVPLILIYSLILYAYIVKIVMTRSLPQGKVAYLVSIYGCVGILAYLAGISTERTRGRFFKFFRAHFFKILIFPAILFAVGITYRLQQYGLTEPRYLLVLCLIWFLLVILFSFTLRPQVLGKAIYISLPLLLLSVSFGPWGVSNLPAIKQSERLRGILVENQIMRDGVITSGSHKISVKDQEQISGILDYLVRRKKTSLLKDWFSDTQHQKVLISQQPIDSKTITNFIGIPYVDKNWRNNKDTLFNYVIKKEDYLKTIGYDYCIPSIYMSVVNNQLQVITRKITITERGQSILVSFNRTSNTLTVTKGHQTLIAVDLDDLLIKLRTVGDQEVQAKKLAVFQEKGKTPIQLIIQRIAGKTTQDSHQDTIEGIEFGLLFNITD